MTGPIPDLTAIDIYETFQAHANAKDGHAPCKIADCIAGYARVGVWVTRARGDDKGTNIEAGKDIGIERIVPDDGHVCAKEGEVLIEVPSERIKVINHKHVQRTSEMFRE